MKHMQHYSVSSSNLKSVGYSAEYQTLEIEFVNGAIYQYYNIPKNIYEELMQASSKGKFVHQQIRNAYPYSRVG